jgi:hypothetical protein
MNKIASELLKIAELLLAGPYSYYEISVNESDISKIGTNGKSFWFWKNKTGHRNSYKDFDKFKKALLEKLDGNEVKFDKYIKEVKEHMAVEQKKEEEQEKKVACDLVAEKKLPKRPNKKEEVWADEEDDMWYVFGVDSGFAYASEYTRQEAERKADKMNKENGFK